MKAACCRRSARRDGMTDRPKALLRNGTGSSEKKTKEETSRRASEREEGSGRCAMQGKPGGDEKRGGWGEGGNEGHLLDSNGYFPRGDRGSMHARTPLLQRRRRRIKGSAAPHPLLCPRSLDSVPTPGNSGDTLEFQLRQGGNNAPSARWQRRSSPTRLASVVLLRVTSNDENKKCPTQRPERNNMSAMPNELITRRGPASSAQ